MKNLIIACTLLISSSLFASNYPPSYFEINACFNKEGPAVFGSAGSGASGKTFIIGYKDSGILGGHDFVDAVVTANCSDRMRENDNFTSLKVIRLGRDWHNTGYMSVPLQENTFCPYGANTVKIAIAFAHFNEWDSKFGANYNFNSWGCDIRFNSEHSGDNRTYNRETWDFITSLMRD